MEWSIQQIAKLSGTTSRTLRHYGDLGLLTPARTGANGYRYYDDDNLVTLQRILLLREMGLGLDDIGGVLARDVSEAKALESHLEWLRQEQDRIARQIAAVTTTLHARKEGVPLVAENTFDGFDHTQYKEEVEERWGADAYRRSDKWWRAMSDAEKQRWQESTRQLGADWTAAAERGIDPASAEAQELAARHVAWLTSIPGTPAADGGDIAGYVRGLGEMYVADPRFGANYGGTTGAELVRDALAIYVSA